MSFNEKLPEWNNPGIEPPQSKKDEGFGPGEKPPAQWFNWLLNRTYKAIQELREKVVIKVAGKDLSSNDYTTEEKIKLGGISKQATKVESSAINGNIKIDGVNAKVYEHPASHSAAMIEKVQLKRFVTEIEKNTWNGKETPSGAQEKANAALATSKEYTDQEIGGKTIDDTLIPTTDTGISVKILLSWLANMIKSITGKANWRTKPTKNLEELNTDIGNHIANSVGHGTSSKAEAQAGTSHASYMTPLRVAEAIASLQAVSSVNGKKGAVTLNNVDVGLGYVQNIPQMNAIAEGSTADPNTTQESYILTSHTNSPIAGTYWHILTLFYNSRAANRSQIAVSYNAGNNAPRMFIRQHFTNVWTPWVELFNQNNYGNVISKSGSFTLALPDQNSIIVANNAATITVPNDASANFPIGTQITVLAGSSSGSLTFVPASGVGLLSKDLKRTMDGLYSSATLIKTLSNQWFLMGALK